jgi:hypothetical protein
MRSARTRVQETFESWRNVVRDMIAGVRVLEYKRSDPMEGGYSELYDKMQNLLPSEVDALTALGRQTTRSCARRLRWMVTKHPVGRPRVLVARKRPQQWQAILADASHGKKRSASAQPSPPICAVH